MGALLGAIAATAPGLINAGVNYGMQKDQQAFNSAEAAKARDFTANENAIARDYNAEQAAIARDWQERMSSTAMSRQVADMKNAGLNVGAMGAGATGAPNATTSAAQASGSTGGYAASSGIGHVSATFGAAISNAIQENGHSIGKDIGRFLSRHSSSGRAEAAKRKAYFDMLEDADPGSKEWISRQR